ncbi:amidohydrolase family protein [Amycolatopsis magusensis]|uniref:L-fuconolactonase n=1 Tax=Amycolatopsis magusensis TaxID=882444 RepID=A0ABS4Q2G4_9PSEU|nr:amidohydrolase family protein [Amycolatopsis magusensis]MBP2185872.1 L-fuconolactonase [Amycolatopsis magusensis]
MPRLDAHHHLWSQAGIDRGDYPWMPPDGPLPEEYLPDRLAPELAAADVTGTIVVQAAPSVAETRFLLDLAARTEFVLGVTGWLPLEQPDALAELAADPYFVGVRPMLQDLPDDDWIGRPEVRPGLLALADAGVRFEALTFTRHLPTLYAVLSDLPELTVVLDHLSKPSYDWEADDGWRAWMGRLAELPNTWCKLSGLLTEVDTGAPVDRFVPYAAFAFDRFGEDRVLFGSDWPVCRLRAEYGDVVRFTEQLISAAGLGDAEGFWRSNAERCYGVRLR